MVVREADLASVIIGFVREKVLTPEAVEYAIDRLRQRQAELSRKQSENEDAGELRQRIAALERRAGELKLEITRGDGQFRLLADLLAANQAALEEARRSLSGSRPSSPSLPRTWGKTEVIRRLSGLRRDLGRGPAAARGLLARLCGPVTVEPVKKQKGWKVTFQPNVLSAFVPSYRAVSNSGSGGGI